MIQADRQRMTEEGECQRLADEVASFVAGTEHPRAMLETMFQNARRHLGALHREAAMACRAHGDWQTNPLAHSDAKQSRMT